MSDDWVVGKVRTNSESKIAGTLEEIGVEAYCPVVRQKGPRRRTDGTREAVERPALPGYLPIREQHVLDARETLEQEPDFYDFLRDIDNVIQAIADAEFDKIRELIRRSEPVVYMAGPPIEVGIIRKVPAVDERIKPWWSMVGEVIERSGKEGYWRYKLGGHKFGDKEVWFSGQQLLANS